MPTPATTLRDTIRDLANEVGHRQFDSTVTVAEAAEYVDHDLACAWAEVEIGNRAPQLILAEAFQDLTDAQAKSVLTCLLNPTDTAHKILAAQYREYIAKDLAREAQSIIDDGPSDSEVESNSYSAAIAYANSVDDPLIADQRYLARQYR